MTGRVEQVEGSSPREIVVGLTAAIYSSSEGSEEEIQVSRVGRVPPVWYQGESHQGYDVEGRKVIRVKDGTLCQLLHTLDPAPSPKTDEMSALEPVPLPPERVHFHPWSNPFAPGAEEKPPIFSPTPEVPKPSPPAPRVDLPVYDLWAQPLEESAALHAFIRRRLPNPLPVSPETEESYNPPPRVPPHPGDTSGLGPILQTPMDCTKLLLSPACPMVHPHPQGALSPVFVPFQFSPEPSPTTLPRPRHPSPSLALHRRSPPLPRATGPTLRSPFFVHHYISALPPGSVVGDGRGGGPGPGL